MCQMSKDVKLSKRCQMLKNSHVQAEVVKVIYVSNVKRCQVVKKMSNVK